MGLEAQGVVATQQSEADDLLYTAWTIIANAGLHRGNWDAEDPEWVAAAERWRDLYHDYLTRQGTERIEL